MFAIVQAGGRQVKVTPGGIVTVDGTAGAPGAELTFDEYVESAGKALPEQCVLIAESFSGPIALAVAARHPGKIRCLVLCATFAVSPFRTLLRGSRFVPKRMFRPSLLLPTMVDHFCFSGASIPVRPSPVAVVSTVPPAIMRARQLALIPYTTE